MDLSASTLRYRLFRSPLQLEPLRILASRRADWQDWKVTFHVLGASHAVRLQRGETTLIELLACANVEGAPPVLLDLAGNTPQTACHHVAGLVCQVALVPFALEEGDALQGAFVRSDRLELAYAAPSGSPIPYTRIGWRLTERELTLETVHTYPEERIGIRSRSRFQREEAER